MAPIKCVKCQTFAHTHMLHVIYDHCRCLLWCHWAVTDVFWEKTEVPLSDLCWIISLCVSSLYVLSWSYLPALLCMLPTLHHLFAPLPSFFFFFSPLSLSVCLFKRERNAAGLIQRQTLWLWLSVCGCERMIKEPAINMTVWWWGCLPICCFIWRLMTSSWWDDLSQISGGQYLRTPFSKPYPDITFFKYAEHG